MTFPVGIEAELQPAAPISPQTISEVGISQSLLEDLLLKVLYLNGPMALTELAARIRLSLAVANELLRRLRAEQVCEITGMKGNIPLLAITGKGRTLALDSLSLNQYAGAAPVSLESYRKQVQLQGVRDTKVHPPDIQRAFSHLVLEPRILKKLGTALNSGSSIFLYGPSGTGKTSIATAMPRALASDRVWVPFAVEVGGQIITVHDPHVHTMMNGTEAQDVDPRWVLCQRPVVIVGGELTLERLELQLHPIAKFYSAPLQMKANNGMLVIDDFGRQRMRPEELLNRWVVPLDRRMDYLTLAGGNQVEVPFEMFVVFATNMNPASLVDAAFLRRIQTKIEVGAVTDAQFHEIFRWVCDEFSVKYEAAGVTDLIGLIRDKIKQPLRACHPRDILNQIRWAAEYEQVEPALDHEAILSAVEAYFVADGSSTEVTPVGGPASQSVN